jgi:hypothetical protein
MCNSAPQSDTELPIEPVSFPILLKPKCNQTVDKYVECEYSVLLIDLILFKQTAYRHIIFNRTIKASERAWRRNALQKIDLVCFQDYCAVQVPTTVPALRRVPALVPRQKPAIWKHCNQRRAVVLRVGMGFLHHAHQLNTRYVQLFQTYKTSWTKTTLPDQVDHLTYFVLICTFLLLLNGKFWFRKNLKNTVNALIVSSFGKLMVIPLVIWNPNQIFFKLANLFTYLSNAHALAGNFFAISSDDQKTKTKIFFQVSTDLDQNKAIGITLVSNMIRFSLNNFFIIFDWVPNKLFIFQIACLHVFWTRWVVRRSSLQPIRLIRTVCFFQFI